MSDWYENFKKDKIISIRARGKSFQESYLHCPHCGYIQEEIWDGFDLTPNGEELEGECQSCNKKFLYIVEFCFSTSKCR
jgi:DNA-directed RNA polymerase subunit RPC12/RpoP